MLNSFMGGIEVRMGETLATPDKEDPNYTYNCTTVEKGDLILTEETWISKDGESKFSKVSTELKRKEETEEEIKAQIKKAVDAEDYETAAKLKKKIEKRKKEK